MLSVNNNHILNLKLREEVSQKVKNYIKYRARKFNFTNAQTKARLALDKIGDKERQMTVLKNEVDEDILKKLYRYKKGWDKVSHL